MASRKSKKHSSLADYVSVPFGDALSTEVKAGDVALGAALGLTLGAGVKYLLNSVNVATGSAIPAVIMSYAGPISTFLAGLGLYLFEKGSHRSRAAGHLTGAAVAAAAPILWTTLGQYGPKMADGTPFFSDYVMTNFGLLTADQKFGLLTEDRYPALPPSMRGHPAYEGNEDYDPMSAP